MDNDDGSERVENENEEEEEEEEEEAEAEDKDKKSKMKVSKHEDDEEENEIIEEAEKKQDPPSETNNQEVKKGWEKTNDNEENEDKENKPENDEIPEVEEERAKINNAPETFAYKLISLQDLEKHSGNFKLSPELSSLKNMMLLTTAVKPKDQVFEKDEEWNYEVLHTEITQITRAQYGEYFQN